MTSNLEFTLSGQVILADYAYHLGDSREPVADNTAIRIMALAIGTFQTAYTMLRLPLSLVQISIDCIHSRSFSSELLYICAKVHVIYLCALVTTSIATFCAIIAPEFVYKNLEFHWHLLCALTSIFTELLPDLDSLAINDSIYIQQAAERLQDLMTSDDPNLWRSALYVEIIRQNIDFPYLRNSGYYFNYFSLTSTDFENAFENCCRGLEGRGLLDRGEDVSDIEELTEEDELEQRRMALIMKQFSEKLLSHMKEARHELIEKEIFPPDEIETMLGESYPAVIELGLLKLLMKTEIESKDILIFDKGTENEFRIVVLEEGNTILEIKKLLQADEMNEESLEALKSLVSRKKMEISQEDTIKEKYPHVKLVFDALVKLRIEHIDPHFINNTGVSRKNRISWLEAFQS